MKKGEEKQVQEKMSVRRRWYDIITIYGYEIIVPGNVCSTEYINSLIGLKTENRFRIYTLLRCITNAWDETQTDADSIFPIIGFEVPDDVSDCLTFRYELNDYIRNNPAYDGISHVLTPRLFSGIDIDVIRKVEEEEEEED